MRKYIDAEVLKNNMHNCIWTQDIKSVEKFVNGLPAADIKPRWIPVTERLPEEVGLYPVTCFDGGRQIDLGQWCIDECGEGFWECDWCDSYSVIAWMPLPEPYKEGEQE